MASRLVFLPAPASCDVIQVVKRQAIRACVQVLLCFFGCLGVSPCAAAKIFFLSHIRGLSSLVGLYLDLIGAIADVVRLRRARQRPCRHAFERDALAAGYAVQFMAAPRPARRLLDDLSCFWRRQRGSNLGPSAGNSFQLLVGQLPSLVLDCLFGGRVQLVLRLDVFQILGTQVVSFPSRSILIR